jgi:hypothetical protein
MIQIIANSHAFPSCALPSPRTQTSLFWQSVDDQNSK